VPEDDEYAAYMRTLIDSRRTVKEPTIDLNNLTEVLDFAIAREKDAVLFYVGLENFVPGEDKPTVKTIIKEEGNHIVKLTNLKQQFA
jgi:rubrerythrin